MNKTLSLGANGPEVLVLQTRLNSKPPTLLPFLVTDGIFGLKTLARVKEFQKNNGLKVDGIVGPMTWGKLLAGPTPSKVAYQYCDNGNPLHKNQTSAMAFIPASFQAVSGMSLSLPSLPKLSRLLPAEVTLAISVYGTSIDFSTVFVSDKTGAGGRAFVLTIPSPLGARSAIQIMNVGPSPSRDTLIHELAHVWQSQHHSSPTQYMVNAVASQALAEATNLALGSKSFSAYGYVPGKTFGEYAAEQIAQQVENGETAIVAHVKSVGARVVDPENNKSLATPRVEDTSLPGVKT